MYFCWKCSSRYPIYREWCSVCMDSRTVLIEPVRPAAAMRTQLQTSTARDLVKRKWTTLESQAYPDLLISKGALVSVWGDPGGGKSTFATRYADRLDGPVVYFSAEEKLGPTLAARLERCGVHRADFHAVGQGSVDELVDLCRAVGAICLVIDSIAMTTIRPEDLRRLLEAAQVDVLMYIMHATKAGTAAGSNAYLHEADVIVAIIAMQWSITKSRYQATTDVRGSILDNDS